MMNPEWVELVDVWDCANGVAFLDNTRTQYHITDVGRVQRDSNRRWRYGNGAWGGPESLIPKLRLEDLRAYVSEEHGDLEAGLSRH